MLDGMRCERHNQVVDFIAGKLRENPRWDVLVEPKDARGFKPDIVVRMKDKSKAWIIDPTIRMETTIEDIARKNTEKETKYAATAEEIRREGFSCVVVKGLWIGARGIISSDCKTFLKSIGFEKQDFQKMICLVLRLSHSMYSMFLH